MSVIHAYYVLLVVITFIESINLSSAAKGVDLVGLIPRYVCKDNGDNCEESKSEGLCKLDVAKRDCIKTCDLCSGCVDFRQDCQTAFWTCDQAYFIAGCQRTCGICELPNACYDTFNGCHEVKANNMCHIKIAREKCKRTCDYCIDDSTYEPPVLPDSCQDQHDSCNEAFSVCGNATVEVYCQRTCELCDKTF